jgi:hypothetical protein
LLAQGAGGGEVGWVPDTGLFVRLHWRERVLV